MRSDLPELSTMTFPAFITLSRGKRISKSGIHLSSIYEGIQVKDQNLNKFVSIFGFEHQKPLCFLYPMAQRAQVKLMLKKSFTIAIPGMVHVENYLTELGPYDLGIPFDLKTSIDVEFKEQGSLVPVLNVSFHQNGQQVATCKSVYLAKRRTKNSQAKGEPEPRLDSVYMKEAWDLPQTLGKQYASISGDKNPIHTSALFAKLMGFQAPIIHGWYSVSRIEHTIENLFNAAVSNIEVKFLAPALLPSRPTLQISENQNGEVRYQLLNEQHSKILLSGKMNLK